ncbi:MAG: hypothetical protein E7294_06040 [Lachnospiraceae bacterium]|nr:hypothetical protein [Lachnospiraceae bacterium]
MKKQGEKRYDKTCENKWQDKEVRLLQQKYLRLSERTSKLYEQIEKSAQEKQYCETGMYLLSSNLLLSDYRVLLAQEKKQSDKLTTEPFCLQPLIHETEKEIERLTGLIRIMRQNETALRQKTEAENLSLYSYFKKLLEEGNQS